MQKYNRYKRWTLAAAVQLAVLSAAAVPGEVIFDDSQTAGEAVQDGMQISASITVTPEDAAEDPDIILFDEGGVTVIREGFSLDELEEAERQAEAARLAAQLVEEVPVPEAADAGHLTEYLAGLYAVDNPTGSNGELEIASYIEKVMQDLGYTVEEQAFHEGFLNTEYRDVPGLNILAERGANSLRAGDRILIVAAHYDSKTDPLPGDVLANDKTGAAVLLETARVLSAFPTDVDVCFVFLSGEEDGLYGSEKLTEFLTEEQRSRVCGVLYVGTVGTESDAPYLLGTDAGEANEPGTLVRAIALEREAEALLVDGISGDQTDGSQGNEQEADGESSEEETGVTGSERAGLGIYLPAYPYAETTPENWSFVGDLWSGRTHFSEISLPVVSIFQDVTGLYAEGQAATVHAPEQGTTAEGTTADSAAAAEDSMAEEAGNESTPPVNMEQLQKCTDILARTIVQYMYRNSV